MTAKVRKIPEFSCLFHPLYTAVTSWRKSTYTMPKTTYHISLKGYVGGWDFDRSDVDPVLAENEGKRVNVLIDSLGGSLATGLSTAFRNHGDVAVHFVGLNAFAAIITSLCAAHIYINAGTMYLVHQGSKGLFESGTVNSAQFDTLIADCEKIKADIDKLDLNCARLYVARCKHKPEDLSCSIVLYLYFA